MDFGTNVFNRRQFNIRPQNLPNCFRQRVQREHYSFSFTRLVFKAYLSDLGDFVYQGLEVDFTVYFDVHSNWLVVHQVVVSVSEVFGVQTISSGMHLTVTSVMGA